MRALLAVLLLTPSFALAEPSAQVETIDVLVPVNPLDGDRLFNSTEVFRLDPGTYRLELRFASGAPASQPTMELRGEAGLVDHLQLVVAQDASLVPGGNLTPTATTVGARYTLGRLPGDVPGNPAIEAEVIPRLNAPARGALRLLVAKELVPRLVVALNGYIEQNLNRSTSAGVDGALGLTGGGSYDLVRNLLRVGGEAQIGSAQYGTPRYFVVADLGPDLVLHRGPFALTASLLLDLVRPRVGLEPSVTAGATF